MGEVSMSNNKPKKLVKIQFKILKNHALLYILQRLHVGILAVPDFGPQALCLLPLV